MLRFYTDVLGCSFTKRNERLGMIHLRAGKSQIDLVDADGALGLAGGAPPGKEGHNVDHICLRIEPFDVEALRVHFLNHGIDLGAVHQNFGAEGYGSAFYLKDPEGNSLELKGPSVQQAGRDDA
ncbi:VOC family protein [Cyanobium sp. ATX 6F1]|nr:VOC family protein [Cyanobium sp. ATX 6F1]